MCLMLEVYATISVGAEKWKDTNVGQIHKDYGKTVGHNGNKYNLQGAKNKNLI